MGPGGAAGHVLRQRRQHRHVLGPAPARRGRGLVLLAEQEPVLLVPVELRRHERPDALETLAGEPDRQAAVALLLQELVGARVPDLDGARSVLPGRDLPGERRVLERVVLDVDGEVALPRLERHALGDGPARERTVALEAEVVMEPARVVALDDEDRPARRAVAVAERLRRRSILFDRRPGGWLTGAGLGTGPLPLGKASQGHGDNPVDAVDCGGPTLYSR
jgi:hypothetical protein